MGGYTRRPMTKLQDTAYTPRRIVLWLLLLCVFFVAGHAQALPVIRASIHGATGAIPLSLEVAATPQIRARGLMQRTTLAPNDGMLFAFPRAERISFWMKDTPLPLDILFVGADGKITHIAHDTTPFSLTPIDSGAAFLTAIELAAGRAKRDGIRVGATVHFTLPKDVHVE